MPYFGLYTQAQVRGLFIGYPTLPDCHRPVSFLSHAERALSQTGWTELGGAVSVGVADLSGLSYPAGMGAMRGITIKLSEATVRQLRQQARQSGRSVAAVVRELVE